MTDARERFDALPKSDQEAILEKHRDWNVHDDWWDSVYEGFVEKVTELGFEVGTYPVQTYKKKLIEKPAIYFSGFGSQGDGACFNGSVGKCETVFTRLAPILWEHWDKIEVCTASWYSSGNYCHSNTLSFSYEFEVPNQITDESDLRWCVMEQLRIELEAAWNTFTDALEVEVKGLCDQLYSDLSDEYDYLTSDESILESLIANDQLNQEIDEHEQASA